MTKLLALYRNSQLARLVCALRRCWSESCVYSLICWILSRPPLDEGSRVRQWLGRQNQKLSGAATLRDAINSSNLNRLWQRICKAGRESRLLGWAFSQGATGLLLVILGLYTPIDYLLRDVFSIPVVSSGWDEGLLLLAVVWIVVIRIRETPALPSAGTPLDLPVFFFLCMCVALLLIRMRLVGINITGFRATAQYLLWFFLATRLLRNDKQCQLLYRTMIAVAAVIALHGIYQYIVAAPIPEHWTDHAETAVRTRVYSIFGSPNIMGDFMVLFAPMTVGLAYSVKNKIGKLVLWGAAACMCLSCLFTMSRGAWVAMAVAVLVYALLADRRLLALMAVALVAALFVPFVANRLTYVFTNDFAESTARGGRAVRWAQTMEYLYKDNPVFGMGFGMFGGAVAMQNKVSTWMEYFYTDNYYIKILAENGYVGLVSFLLMMAGLLWTGLRGWFRQRQSKVRSPLCAGMLAGLSGVLVHCYFENIFEEPYMAVCFWTVAAMLMYYGYLRERLGIQ